MTFFGHVDVIGVGNIPQVHLDSALLDVMLQTLDACAITSRAGCCAMQNRDSMKIPHTRTICRRGLSFSSRITAISSWTQWFCEPAHLIVRFALIDHEHCE